MANDILIVDDEADIRALIAGILEDEGYDTRQAADSDEALAKVNDRVPGLLILDIWLQNSALDGLEILDRVQEAHPNLPVVMISGHGTIKTAVNAIKRGAYDFIEKPFKADRLLLLVRRATEAARLRRENLELLRKVGSSNELIGNSSGLTQVRSAVEKVAPTNSRVLITGPAGAGKEVVAGMIHARSGRVSGPMVVLNCATLNPERLETELFGTESFGERQGASNTVGVFERAHKGTLFLDEVADMPLETQGKIVRVLQEQRFRRVGGKTEVEVDVRVIASTNRDLQQEISTGRFREDLFYRLNVVPVRVPALRERREDIPRLTKYFLRQSAEASGTPLREISEDAVAALQAYDWPGNVRQLRNVIDWLLIMAPGTSRDTLRADMLPPEIVSVAPTTLQLDRGVEIMGMPLRDARETFEREYLLAQVNRFGGNISRTASFVGMERSALHRKLKSLGVTQGERPVKTG
jgi:two-component system, NtrC family, nitrogen regulation response regulator NtrX